ncbi:hypothetical protein KUL42_27520 [Alteromonas sp. KUL42]|nr:hypothetical protein KUL42_27520 [Alteromonas sp. KUL42]
MILGLPYFLLLAAFDGSALLTQTVIEKKIKANNEYLNCIVVTHFFTYIFIAFEIMTAVF